MVASATTTPFAEPQGVPPDLLTLDPDNRLLARGPRFRLPAEFIRDSALKVSGLLVPRLGGPSVNPYTPGNLWREISHYGSTPATAQTFEQDHGEKLYRRSMYTYWKRTVPPPNMVAFDAPNREICTVARPTTTTPLQALVLLNDVQFVEASRAFAERILARNDDDETQKLRWAFEECLSRPPTDEELSVLTNTLFREDWIAHPVGKALRVMIAAGGLITATLVVLLATLGTSSVWLLVGLGLTLAVVSVRAALQPTFLRMGIVLAAVIAIPIAGLIA